MKKSVLMIALAFGASTAFAQLTTRENDESVQKMGARPKAGDMAFVMGLDLGGDSATAKLFSGNMLKVGDLLTFKYYKSDDIVIRAGIRLKNDNSLYKGTGLDSSDTYNPVTDPSGDPAYNNLSDVKVKSSSRMWEIVPGVEKHFLASNIFDAYVGADLYLGLGADKNYSEFNYRNGDKSLASSKTNTTNVGLGAVAGFNVFIASLPISLGLEYGWNAKWTFGGVTKVKTETIAGGTSSNTEYSVDADSNGPTDAKYSKLKKRDFNADSNQNVRVVLHIYFGK